MQTFGKIGQGEYNDYQSRRIDSSNKRINRWQDKQISFLSALLAGSNSIAVLSLGFVIRSFEDQLFGRELGNNLDAGRTICMIFVFAIICGIIATFSRFYDIRTTTRVNRNKKKIFILNHNLKYEAEEPYIKNDIKDKMKMQRKNIKKYERCTYFFTYAQIILWVIGVVLTTYNI